MLAVPTKKGKSADWGAPLRDYIAQAYGEKTADEQTESLAKLNQAREWVLSNNKKSDEVSLENIKEYLRMLGAVEARFPIKETHINITFTWYDSFKPAKKFMHHRLEEERAAILFNYAAMESYAGMIQDRNTPEGTQNACNHFITAARYFQFLKDVYIPNKIEGPLTSDMSQEGLTMLTNLMLAQTQACTFEKAVKKKMTPGSLSKIAAGAQQLYNNALLATVSPNLASIIDKSWATHMRFQMNCFAASAAYHYSKVLFKKAEETGEGYGERIAYLKNAMSTCDTVLASAEQEGLSQPQMSTINGLKATISKDLNKAVNDNTSIYMDLVPDQSAIEPPAAHILAKAEVDKVDELLVGPILPGMTVDANEKGADLFKLLLPAEVQMAVAVFKSKVSDLVDRANKLVNEKETFVKEALQGANLPAAIEAAGSSRGLPDETWARILEVVHQKGGINGLKSTLIQNGKLGDQLRAILYDCEQKLTADEANDVRNRQIWGDRWTLPTAMQANSLVKKDWAKYKGFLTEASESDKRLMAAIDGPELNSVLKDLSLSKDGLDALMPDPGEVDDDMHVESIRSKLRMSFINLQTHLQQTTSKLEEFKYAAGKANIIQELFKNSTSAQEIAADESQVSSIIDAKIEELEVPYSEVQTLANEDEAKLSRVLTDNAAYLEARRENSATKARETVLARLEHGIEQYEQLSKHIEEGKKFYASLTEKVNKLQDLVTSHCLSRDLQGKDLEQALTTAISNNTYNQVQPVAQTQAPVSSPYTGQVYNNPNATYQSQAVYQPQPQVVSNIPSTTVQPTQPAVVQVQPQPQPQSSGLSLLEEMKRAQLQAEQNGTLGAFAGITDSPSPSPAPQNNQMDDASAAQAAMAMQQEEIFQQIQMQNAMKESVRTDYTKEMNQVKELLGNEHSDKLIMEHLNATGGNVPVTINNLMEGIAPPKKKKGGIMGMFSRNKKPKPKKNNAGAAVQPNAGGGGGNFTW